MVARQQALTLGIEILRQRLESGFVDHQAWRRGRWAAASRCCTMAARRSARPSEKPANVGGRDMDWHSIAADVRQHFWTYLSLPFVRSVFGYVTTGVAKIGRASGGGREG